MEAVADTPNVAGLSASRLRSRMRSRVLGSPSRGFTILEMMIVLAIVGGLGWLAGSALMKSRGSKLRDGATAVAATLRRGFDRATTTATRHQVAFDFKTNRYWLEQCDAPPEVKRGVDPLEEAKLENERAMLRAQENAAALLARGEERARAAEASGSPTGSPTGAAGSSTESEVAEEPTKDGFAPPPPKCGDATAIAVSDEATAGAQQLSGQALVDSLFGMAQPTSNQRPKPTTFGIGRCCRPKKGGSIHTLKKGLHFVAVDTAHLTEKATEGQVRVHFYPAGYAEKSVVLIGDEDKTFGVTVEPLSGRVRVMTREPNDEEGGKVREDAMQKTAEEE